MHAKQKPPNFTGNLSEPNTVSHTAVERGVV